MLNERHEDVRGFENARDLADSDDPEISSGRARQANHILGVRWSDAGVVGREPFRGLGHDDGVCGGRNIGHVRVEWGST